MKGDPMIPLSAALKDLHVPEEFKCSPSIINGAALGYIGYDCVKYFEPRLAKYCQKDVLGLPESVMMFYDSFVFIDYKTATMKIISILTVEPDAFSQPTFQQILLEKYSKATQKIQELYDNILHTPPNNFHDYNTTTNAVPTSNLGPEGYKNFVSKLKKDIIDGYIIQAVPSQRWARESGIHPFNFFKQLRLVNPSRYTFYIECGDFEIVGSSPELMVKVEDGRVVTHPIAGTRKRGKTEQEDLELEKELIENEKERAEHVMLVDLGRNDVNRVCLPETTNVDSLMHVERFSHVMHIVSQVSGKLRPECTKFDAFSSIFPAGTVSGAPKVQAMELIASLETEKRGVYAGAIGYFSYDGDIDTCIAIRTAIHKNTTYYFQAGAGIVFDSEPTFENEETYHKMAALAKSLDMAEGLLKSQISDPLPLVTSKPFIQLSKLIPQSIAPSTNKTTLLIDNYDSFTWNLYQYLRKLGENVVVYRHDKITIEECLQLNPDRLVISPGPGWPKDAGVSNPAIKIFEGKIPILGVCLGHECIIELFGGEITHCGEVKHGKTSKIQHDGKGVYSGLPQDIEVIRYHSLAANIKKIPDDFVVTSTTKLGIIMGIRHNKYRIEGVQFHPESIKTEYGMEMLNNFLRWESPVW
eukprot:TRINITY_DN5141_c0_g1_i1.p1 TRINITY_DN5141_c0_g1~~TRINITY_DN5141_c0_g1_i1.p1  ORF type:complete len:746 (+),score=172.60 TRINITY_DN5141_c0_g1_i1:321-2240(+)